jgi:3-carboxy-cis,cis-muconate cycloisomerase
MAEPIMLALGEHVGRQEAHDIVYDAAQAASLGGSFSDLLAADTRFTAHLSAAQIDAMLDPTKYTGLCARMAEEQATRARELADRITEAPESSG